MRAFIIGNGISLEPALLDLIAGEPSFACNRISLVYEKTHWRPTHYVHPESLDPDIPYIKENVNLGIPCWIGEHFKGDIDDEPNIHWIKDCHHHLYDFDNPKVPDEWHLPQLCSFGGSVNISMQLAVQLDYTTLVLIGCDLKYKDNKRSHFSSEYKNGMEKPAFVRSRNALFGHMQALNWIRRKKKNITVINATNGGLLELWKRDELKNYV